MVRMVGTASVTATTQALSVAKAVKLINPMDGVAVAGGRYYRLRSEKPWALVRIAVT